jgi:hypothetical protein
MRILWAVVAGFFWTAPALANVPCSLPYTLTNGTTADATQVMANYNALVACLANAAAQGANTDITSLGGLTTPIPPSEGGSPVFIGGTSSGTANAQIIATTPASFTLTKGYTVQFIPGATLTNSGAMQVNVNGTGLVNLYRPGASGPAAMSGGEVIAGNTTQITYDGTEFVMAAPQNALAPTGVTFPAASTGALASLGATDQALVGGANVTPNNLGTLSTGTYTIDCGKGPLQYGTNGGTFTLAAPAADGSCMVQLTNNGSAVAPSFSGFTVGSNTGDTYGTTSTNVFTISVWRINGVASYFIKALQ